jgi:hypothetical protein
MQPLKGTVQVLKTTPAYLRYLPHWTVSLLEIGHVLGKVDVLRGIARQPQL